MKFKPQGLQGSDWAQPGSLARRCLSPGTTLCSHLCSKGQLAARLESATQRGRRPRKSWQTSW